MIMLHSRAPSLCRNDSAIARALDQEEATADEARRRQAASAAAASRPRPQPPARRPKPNSRQRRAAEEARLARRLRERGLAARGVRGDGSCQFRSLADQMWGDERHHSAVRRSTIAELWRRPALYAPFVAGAGTYAEYVYAMAQPGTWGDHVSLLAACNAFGVTAVLVTSFSGGGGGGGGGAEERGDGSDRAAVVVVAPSVPQQQEQQQPPPRIAYLSYLGELHYDSLCARPPAAKKVLGSRRLGRLLFGGGGGGA